MNEKAFKICLVSIALIFAIIFATVVVPALIKEPNILAAFGAGFVNPFASGYSSDVIACWFILAVWIFFERQTHAIRYGWVCCLLGIIPGVAIGFAAYLLLRHRQLNQ